MALYKASSLSPEKLPKEWQGLPLSMPEAVEEIM
jgi:hypothetical protein